MAWHSRRPTSRPRRLRWSLGVPADDHLLRDRNVRVGRIETTGAIQQSLGNPTRRNEYPICPGLRHHGI
jgi:hypothetical protein